MLYNVYLAQEHKKDFHILQRLNSWNTKSMQGMPTIEHNAKKCSFQWDYGEPAYWKLIGQSWNLLNFSRSTNLSITHPLLGSPKSLPSSCPVLKMILLSSPTCAHFAIWMLPWKFELQHLILSPKGSINWKLIDGYGNVVGLMWPFSSFGRSIN